MDKDILLKAIEETSINTSTVQAVESIYGKCNNEEAKKLITISANPIHSNGWRVLSLNEIMKASEQLQVDFADRGLLPLIDYFDNDFIVYDLKDAYWEMYNIVEDVKYMRTDDLSSLL